MHGIPFPPIGVCPDCSSWELSGVQVSREGVSISLDGHGGVSEIRPDEILETRYTYLECRDCGVVLVEDGEVVHDGVPGHESTTIEVNEDDDSPRGFE